MIKREIAEGIFEYVFGPRQPHHHFADRIVAIVSGNKAMLIDTGYEDEAREVLRDLTANGIGLHSVIISHFHDDHMEGLKALPDVPVYGSARFQETLDRWNPKEEHQYFTPMVPVDAPLSIQFGPHEIEIIPFPGHSVCTVLLKIDNTFLYIADEVMFTPEGEPLMPCIKKDDAKIQLASLGRLKGYLNYSFIPAHGDNIKSRDDILSAIENTMLYLGQVSEHDGKISYEEATKDCTCEFVHKEWHENVYR